MKQCIWDGEEIKEEEGSLELRTFHKDGKTCSYFCNFDCLVQWMKANMKTDIFIGDGK